MDRGQRSAVTAHLQVSAWGRGGVRWWVFGGVRWSVMLEGEACDLVLFRSPSHVVTDHSLCPMVGVWGPELPVKPEDQFLVGSNAVLMT